MPYIVATHPTLGRFSLDTTPARVTLFLDRGMHRIYRLKRAQELLALARGQDTIIVFPGDINSEMTKVPVSDFAFEIEPDLQT